MTSCPAFTHSPPIVEPMRPEPITPIFIGFCAKTGSASVAPITRRKFRLFMRGRLSQLESIHGPAAPRAPRLPCSRGRDQTRAGTGPHHEQADSLHARAAAGDR